MSVLVSCLMQIFWKCLWKITRHLEWSQNITFDPSLNPNVSKSLQTLNCTFDFSVKMINDKNLNKTPQSDFLSPLFLEQIQNTEWKVNLFPYPRDNNKKPWKISHDKEISRMLLVFSFYLRANSMWSGNETHAWKRWQIKNSIIFLFDISRCYYCDFWHILCQRFIDCVQSN